MGNWSKRVLGEFSRWEAARKRLEESAALRQSVSETEIPKAWQDLKRMLISEVTAVSEVHPYRYSVVSVADETIKLVGHHEESIQLYVSLKRLLSNGEEVSVVQFIKAKTSRYTNEERRQTYSLRFEIDRIGGQAVLTAGADLKRNSRWHEMFPQVDCWVSISEAAEFLLTTLERW